MANNLQFESGLATHWSLILIELQPSTRLKLGQREKVWG
jgi:hypothetical protein